MSLPKCTLSVDNASVLRADGRECVCARACLLVFVCVLTWGACVAECQRPHRDVGGIVWGSRGEHWSLIFGNCIWIFSFLDRRCP